MLLLLAAYVVKVFLKHVVNVLLKLFKVTYLLQHKDIGLVNHKTKLYTTYIMLSWTSAVAVILANSYQEYTENDNMLAPKESLFCVALTLISKC